MTTTRALFIFIVFMTIGCNFPNYKKIIDDKSVSGIEGRWRMISYEKYSEKKVIFPDSSNTWYSVNNGNVDVGFDTNKMEAIVLENIMWGTYNINDRDVTFSDVFGHSFPDPKWPENFRICIEKVNRFEVNKDYLRLYCDTFHHSMTFRKL